MCEFFWAQVYKSTFINYINICGDGRVVMAFGSGYMNQEISKSSLEGMGSNPILRKLFFC
jgi:hypothetical protein